MSIIKYEMLGGKKYVTVFVDLRKLMTPEMELIGVTDEYGVDNIDRISSISSTELINKPNSKISSWLRSQNYLKSSLE